MPNFENHPLYPGNGSPIFIAAGVFKEPHQLEPLLGGNSPSPISVATLGAFTGPPNNGNARNSGDTDVVYYSDRRMAGNARGLQSLGKDGVLAMKEPIRRLAERGIKTVMQVASLPYENPLRAIPELAALAADCSPTAIEVNLSCPNGMDADGGFHPLLCDDPDASGELMAAVRQKIGEEVCLGVKDSPHTTALDMPVDELAVTRLVRAVRP